MSALGPYLAVSVFLWGADVMASETVTYLHRDATGSVVAGTDASGMVVWREAYRPFGRRLLDQTAASDENTWFAGHRESRETGLVYMGLRHYDPLIGRFLSRDPVAVNPLDPHSFGRYLYANNNPLRFFDPDGAEPVPIKVPSVGFEKTHYEVALPVLPTAYAVQERAMAMFSDRIRRKARMFKHAKIETTVAAKAVGIGIAAGVTEDGVITLDRGIYPHVLTGSVRTTSNDQHVFDSGGSNYRDFVGTVIHELIHVNDGETLSKLPILHGRVEADAQRMADEFVKRHPASEIQTAVENFPGQE